MELETGLELIDWDMKLETGTWKTWSRGLGHGGRDWTWEW